MLFLTWDCTTYTLSYSLYIYIYIYRGESTERHMQAGIPRISLNPKNNRHVQACRHRHTHPHTHMHTLFTIGFALNECATHSVCNCLAIDVWDHGVRVKACT